MKRLCTLLLAAALLVLTGCASNVIGTIHGPEWDTIIVDDVSYTKVSGSGVTAADQGDYLGTVTDGDKITFRVYSVKNHPEGEYLYCLWDWEGSIYQRAEEP